MSAEDLDRPLVAPGETGRRQHLHDRVEFDLGVLQYSAEYKGGGPRVIKVSLGSCVTSITGPNGGAELYER